MQLREQYQFAEIFKGAELGRGQLVHHDLATGKKDSTYVHHKIDFESHTKGITTQGLSPVNESKRSCRWIVIDVDDEIEAKKICKELWELDQYLFPFKSLNGRWHIYYFFRDWISVDEAKKKAKVIEDRLVFLDYEVDTGHTLPKGYNLDQMKAGHWIYLPYSNGKNVCYSPLGNPLSLEQFEFRFKHRRHPLIAGSIGVKSGQGGRYKILFNCAVYLKHIKVDTDLNEINKYFGEPIPENDVQHALDSANADKYDLEYLQGHLKHYSKENTGVGVLDNFGATSGETTEAQKNFFDNLIYVKLDDRFFDKTTGNEYKKDAINVAYAGTFRGKPGTVVKNFGLSPDAKIVESMVYRPDLFKEDNGLYQIVEDEQKLQHINIYRPTDCLSIPALTVQQKDVLELFFKLIEFLIPDDNERNWVLDWLSTILKYPGRKIRHSILIYSKHFQIGKSSLFKLIMKILGEHNCSIIGPRQALDKGKGYLVDKQLVLIDEIKSTGKWEERNNILNLLKPLMTEEIHDVRPLFKDWKQVYSTTNFFLYTNHADAISVSKEEARYTVLENLEERLDDEFYQTYWNALKDGELAGLVKHFLEKRKIKEYDDLTKDEIEDGKPTVPLFKAEGTCLRTEALEKMSLQGEHETFRNIMELYEEGAEPFNQDLVSIVQLQSILRQRGQGSRLNEINTALDKLGGKKLGKAKHVFSGRTPTLYAMDKINIYVGKYTAKECVNEYWLPLAYAEWGMETNQANVIQANQRKMGTKEANVNRQQDPPWSKGRDVFDTVHRKLLIKDDGSYGKDINNKTKDIY